MHRIHFHKMLSVSRPHDLILVIFAYFEQKSEKCFNKNSISPYLQILKYQRVFHINLYTFYILMWVIHSNKNMYLWKTGTKASIILFSQDNHRIKYYSVLFPQNTLLLISECAICSHMFITLSFKKKNWFKYPFGNSQVKIMAWSSSIFPVSWIYIDGSNMSTRLQEFSRRDSRKVGVTSLLNK